MTSYKNAKKEVTNLVDQRRREANKTFGMKRNMDVIGNLIFFWKKEKNIRNHDRNDCECEKREW